VFIQLQRPVPGTEPAVVLRELAFMANLAAQETTGDTATSLSVERLAHRLRGSAVYDSVALARVDAPMNSPLSSLGYPVVTDPDSEVAGFLLLGMPLTEDRDVLDVEVILDAGHLPLPGAAFDPEGRAIIDELLAEADTIGARLGRTTLQTWLLHPADEEPGTGEFAAVLRSAGYRLGLTEIQGHLPVIPRPVDHPWEISVIVDLDVPDHLTDDVIGLYQLGSDDMPRGGLQESDITWTRQRLTDAAARLRDTGRRSLIVLAHDDSGPVGLTEVRMHQGSDETVLEQDLTVVATPARGRGVATALKQELLNRAGAVFPAAARVYTSCAVDNHAMIAVNEALGWTRFSGGSGWEKRL